MNIQTYLMYKQAVASEPGDVPSLPRPGGGVPGRPAAGVPAKPVSPSIHARPVPPTAGYIDSDPIDVDFVTVDPVAGPVAGGGAPHIAGPAGGGSPHTTGGGVPPIAGSPAGTGSSAKDARLKYILNGAGLGAGGGFLGDVAIKNNIPLFAVGGSLIGGYIGDKLYSLTHPSGV